MLQCGWKFTSFLNKKKGFLNKRKHKPKQYKRDNFVTSIFIFSAYYYHSGMHPAFAFSLLIKKTQLNT